VRRILIVDDFKPWRDAARDIIEAQPELQVIAEASDGQEAVQLAAALKPDLVVLDIGLPRINGLQAAGRIFKVSPATRVLFLSMQNDPATIEATLSLGAAGYVNKLNAGDQLLSAIATALDPVLEAVQ
jgi:DNA-binding NarL/FixJ family response regulator